MMKTFRLNFCWVQDSQDRKEILSMVYSGIDIY